MRGSGRLGDRLRRHRPENFSRTCWITFHCRGTTSSVSVTSSPILRKVPPQHRQAEGAGYTIRLARQVVRKRTARRLAPFKTLEPDRVGSCAGVIVTTPSAGEPPARLQIGSRKISVGFGGRDYDGVNLMRAPNRRGGSAGTR